MARRQRTSLTAEKAHKRALGITAFAPAFDLGDGISLTALQTKTGQIQSMVDEYNSKLTELDAMLNQIQREEKALNELSTRLLAGVGAKYGKDSDEYEQAGGTRTSEIQRPPRTQKPADG
jgi:hypothetical protein